MAHLDITKFDHVLSPRQCGWLKAKATEVGMDEHFRTSRMPGRVGCKFTIDNKVTNKLKRVLATQAAVPLEYIEDVEVVQYSIGVGYPLHLDGPHRAWSLVCYLNDVYCGGETFFPHASQQYHKARKGNAIIWQNNNFATHQAVAPTGGTKWVAVCWAWRQPVDRSLRSGQVPAK